jgi:hypothetical protein
MTVNTVKRPTLEVFECIQWIERLHSPDWGRLRSKIRLSVNVLSTFVLIAFASSAMASETIFLDPKVPRPPPATILDAIVTGEVSQARCSLRLMPNGVVGVMPACALAERLRGVATWQRSATQITFRDAKRSRVLTFYPAGANSFRTRVARPERLRLFFLPQSSMPMSQ